MTIIAAIDFTEVSREVARVGARVARRFGDRLLLVHAVEPSSGAYGGAVPMAVDVAPEIDAGEESLRAMRSALIAEGAEVEIDTQVVIGPPDRVMEEVVKGTGARLLVAGTHGRGAIGRLLVGSVAERLVLRLSCPVLVVRTGGGAGLERWLKGERPLRVVVGVDRKGRGTDAALGWARQLGELGPCDLTFMHEYWPPAEYTRLGLQGPRDLFETDREVAAVLQRELEARVGTFAWAPNARLQVQAAWGPIGEALAREAEVGQADLIVVGTEQPHGWQRVKRGSAALSALHAAPVPLLSAPTGTRDGAHDAHPPALPPALRAILAATDLSEEGNAAVAHAFALLRAEGGVVHLCHVHERPLPSPPYAYAAEAGALDAAHRSELEARLGALIPGEAAELEIEARVAVVDGGTPAAQIAAAARRAGADAIVIASHGRSGVKHAVLGSVAEAVLRQADVPVYVVRRRDGNVR